MTAPPRVSVLMAVRNGREHVREAVDSLLAQTLVDIEVIVVDDGSTDETPELLASMAERDSRLTILRNDTSIGLPASLNRAAREARAPLLARHDADDRSHPDRLLLQADIMEGDPTLAALGTAHASMDTRGRTLLECGAPRISLERAALTRSTVFAHGSAMIRAEELHATGGYDERFHFSQDLELWCRLAGRGATLAVLDRPLYRMRSNPEHFADHKQGFQERFSRLIHRRHFRDEDVGSEAEALREEILAASPPGLDAAVHARYWYNAASWAALQWRVPAMLSALGRAFRERPSLPWLARTAKSLLLAHCPRPTGKLLSIPLTDGEADS